mmetsp:Transcript_35448/g.56824  ORF Transcript_35448/g.56824 Transcript_35448/m.56824 type:complete len:210 (-) Transcript_35448:908-1537(-)
MIARIHFRFATARHWKRNDHVLQCNLIVARVLRSHCDTAIRLCLGPKLNGNRYLLVVICAHPPFQDGRLRRAAHSELLLLVLQAQDALLPLIGVHPGMQTPRRFTKRQALLWVDVGHNHALCRRRIVDRHFHIAFDLELLQRAISIKRDKEFLRDEDLNRWQIRRVNQLLLVIAAFTRLLQKLAILVTAHGALIQHFHVFGQLIFMFLL